MRFGRKCSLPRFRYLLIASTDTVLAISRVPISADTTGERQHRYGGIGADAKSRRRITWGCAALSIAQPSGNAAGDQPPGLPSLHRLSRQMPESSCTPVSSASGLRSAAATRLTSGTRGNLIRISYTYVDAPAAGAGNAKGILATMVTIRYGSRLACQPSACTHPCKHHATITPCVGGRWHERSSARHIKILLAHQLLVLQIPHNIPRSPHPIPREFHADATHSLHQTSRLPHSLPSPPRQRTKQLHNTDFTQHNSV